MIPADSPITSFQQNGRRINMAVAKSEPVVNFTPFGGQPPPGGPGRTFVTAAAASAVVTAVMNGKSVTKHPIFLDSQVAISVFKDESLFVNSLQRAK